MPVNRFYTPSLPQYTSQFVQDETPWDALIGLEDQKLARTDAALSGAAKAESQFTSLTPGYRTGEIAPEVIRDYEKELAGWQEKHKGQLYSVPAMRELTKLQGKFQGDKRVKMIQQDYAQNDYYDRLKANKDYRAETDPNIDPETGQIKQFGVDSKFTPYDTPVYYGDVGEELDPILSSIQSRKTPVNDIRYIKDKDGNKIPVKFSGTKEELNEQDFENVRQDLVDKIYRGEGQGSRYLQARYRDEWTPEFVDKLVREREGMRYIDRETGTTQFLPGYGSSSGKDPEDVSAYEFNATTQEQIPADNGGGSGEAPIRKATEIGAGFREWRMGAFGGKNGENFYQNAKNDPGAMISGKTVDPNTGKTLRKDNTIGITDKDVVTRAVYEQPFTTISRFDDFWEESFADPNLTESDRKKMERKKKTYDSYIADAKKKYKIGEPNYTNDIELNKSMSAVAESAAAGFPDTYDGPPIDDPFNMTPEQAIKLRVATEKYDSEIMDRGFVPGFLGFSEDVQKEFTSRFAGLNVDSNGVVKTDNGLPEQLAGATLINPEDPNDFIKVKDKRNFYKKGDPLYVTGMYENTSSQYGPGIFSLTTGDKNYLVRGPKELVEPYEFTNVIHTHEHPKNNDEGDYFAFRGLTNTGNYDVRYRWNKETKEPDAADVWMNVSLDRVQDPNDPKYVLRVFQTDPNSIDDDSYLNLYDEENNPNGYYNYPILDEEGEPYNKAYKPTDFAVKKKVMGSWLGSLVDENQITEEQAIGVYQRAFPVNEQ